MLRISTAVLLGTIALSACDTQGTGPTGNPAGSCSDAEFRHSGRCAALTVCSLDEFEARSPSSDRDRLCLPLTVCKATEYETHAPSAKTDRDCRRLTQCTNAEFESRAPTSTRDRLCDRLTRCTLDEFESVAPTATSDRECLELTECDEDEYEVTPPTELSDRVCDKQEVSFPVTECTDDEYEVSPPSATDDRVCAPVAKCRADQHQVSAPTATSDRVCADLTVCTYDEYEAEPPHAGNDRVCAPITICDPDTEYESRAPTATSDRMCMPYRCPPTTYQVPVPGVLEPLCVRLTTCTADEYQTVAPTATTDRVCGGLSACSPDEYQSVAPTATTDRVCSALTVCTADEYESAAPTATTDRVCALLPECPAVADDGTPTDPGYDVAISFVYTGADQQFTVPAGVVEMKFKVWGAGGGGFGFWVSGLENTMAGGAGGYSEGVLTATEGDTFTIVVGEGGSFLRAVLGSTPRTYGGGGGGDKSTSGGLGEVGAGGGMSGIFRGLVNQVNALLIAGGGGGSGDGPTEGSEDESSGGNGNVPVTEGYKPLLGQDGAEVSTWGYGGGGGGYVGGVSGVDVYSFRGTFADAGEGGHGFIADEIINGSMLGSPQDSKTPPNDTALQYDGTAGMGGRDPIFVGGPGGHGLVVVQLRFIECRQPQVK